MESISNITIITPILSPPEIHKKNPSSPKASKEIKKESLRILFYSSIWLGKIKQALTIYKETVRKRLNKFNPEN